MEKLVDVIIQKESNNLQYKDRSYLLGLGKHEELQNGVEIIYIFSLVEQKLNYPMGNGNILYIGEAYRYKSPTGERFKHIASDLEGANDFTCNYTLTQYYELRIPIRLEIYKVPKDLDRKDLENVLIRKHMKTYGCKPIAQGATGGHNTPKYINEKIEEYEGLEDYI